jgi:hypothetical protein
LVGTVVPQNNENGNVKIKKKKKADKEDEEAPSTPKIDTIFGKVKSSNDSSTKSTDAKTRCAVLFIVNRDDCEVMRPCHEADPLFAQMVLRARNCGVQVLAKSVTWETDSEGFLTGRAHMGRSLPVVFHESVTDDVDEEHLSEVLAFNGTPKK